MNISNWIKEIIEADKRFSMPIMTHPGIELLGKTVQDAVTDGNIHYEAICALNARFPQSVACTTIMDLTVEAETFGARLCMTANEVPTVIGRLLTCYDDVLNLKIPTLQMGRIPQYLKADSLAASHLDKPVFAGCIGPYSLAGRLYDMTEMMMAMYTEPQTATLLLEKCTTFLTEYCQAIKSTGVAGVIMAEPASGLLSDEDCLQFSSVYIKQIVDAVQDDSFAVILHNCGNMGQCTSAMIKTGAKGYHFGNKIDMVEALQSSPSDALVMGNLDPVELFKMASAEDMYVQTKQLLERTDAFPNFVISSGCDTPPDIPMANIASFYKAVDDYNANKELLQKN